MMVVDFYRRARQFALASLAAVGLSASAQAATVLTIDVTDPSAVVVTATGALSEQTASITAFRGFSLLNFFTAPAVTNDTLITGTLASTAGTPAAVSRTFIRNGGTYLNFYRIFTGWRQMSFNSAAPAFSGSTSFNLSGYSTLFPAVGSSGRIALGDNLGAPFGAEIGDWEVVTTASVPLPASLGFLLLGTGALGLMRRQS